ncbi:short chain dehydrogenase/ reductase [Bimuria novae-zelandiae CBS 107.79]|uniref:Short chain dehydrogenase/ reductase n=1 Tax=Bimuria novae-zelandiae CBS 107.79 TaxID=1447943 RepID=A0A6A5VBB7_9PLEO|nr:short chain dehydrogenase/ reductase [Bimuria novae-zelandiae CBS 107.79]
MAFANGSNGVGASAKDPVLIDPRTRFSDLKLKFPHPSLTIPVLQRDFPTKPDCGETSYKGYGRLAGRRALITGGDSGIGRAVAIAMAREGANVAINYLPVEELDAQDVADLLAKEGIKITRIPGDLLDEEFCSNLVLRAERALGGIDILVNNAGTGGDLNPDITTYTTKQWDCVFRTNVYAGFFLARAAIPKMPPGSSIIWTVSDVVANPTNAVHDYAATKGAVASLVQTLGISLASKGIRVNGVAPGLTYTPLVAGMSMTTEQLNDFAQTLPLRRPAQPVEMAPLYVNFADKNATYLSGGILQNKSGTLSYSFPLK